MAQSLRRKLLSEDEGNVNVRRDLAKGCYNLANLYASQANYHEAWANYYESPEARDVDKARENREVARSYYPLAEENLAEAVKLFEEVLAEDPKDLTNQYHLAVCCRQLGDLKAHLNKHDDGLQLYDRARALMERLAAGNPDVPEYRADTAALYLNLGLLQRERDDLDAARIAQQEALQLLEELVGEYPEVPRYAQDLAQAFRETARLEIAAGQLEEARRALLQALNYFRDLVAKYPDQPEYPALLEEVKQELEQLKEAEP
jgi:tetratricopeptide (TPR) repeat protein